MEASFLTLALSLIFLLIISLGVFLVSKKFNFPYTVLLVLIGIILVPVSHNNFFSFVDDFRLTPEILFYVFLPILLFESAYSINYKQLLKNWKSLVTLSIFSLLISVLSVASILYISLIFFGFPIPFIVCLLFGSIISATDPVAVLSIFKSIGAPRRLILLFKGESIFNDGTALALFLLILGIILEGNLSSVNIFFSSMSFFSMIFGGIIFGLVMGSIFSLGLGKIKSIEPVEIGLTIIMSHLTFILSDIISEYLSIGGVDIKVSGVIATAVAGITLGNYGRYKISKNIEESIEKFLSFFAFVANSLVFILLGIILSDININFTYFLPFFFIAIITVMFSRALSIYLPIGILNFMKVEEAIPLSWQHLLSWGSLRGALAIMMVLLIPDVGQNGYQEIIAYQESIGWTYSFSIKDFVMTLTIACIMFTLFVKATSIGYFAKKFKIDKLHNIEEFEMCEGQILMNMKALEKLSGENEKGFLKKGEYQEITLKYQDALKEALSRLKSFLTENPQQRENIVQGALMLHALGIEKQFLKDLYQYHEIDEYNFKTILGKINRQVDRIESGVRSIVEVYEQEHSLDVFERMFEYLHGGRENFTDIYMRYRTREIISKRVVTEFKHLKQMNLGFDTSSFDEIIELYLGFYEYARSRKNSIRKKHNISILSLEAKLTDKGILKIEEKVIEELYEKEIITPKIYVKLRESIEEEIVKDFRRIE